MQAFPYKTLWDEIDCLISDLIVDESDQAKQHLRTDNRTIELSAINKPWETAAFEVELSCTEQELGDLQEDDVGAIAVLHCPATGRRVSKHLHRVDKNGTVSFTGTLKIVKAEYAGKVEMRPVIVGRVDGMPHRFLGNGQSWTIHVDTPSPFEVTGSIPVQWKDFTDSDETPDLTEFEKELFFLDLSAGPRVFLNKGFDGLAELLQEDKGRKPLERAFHEAEHYSIARSVWVALFETAASAVDRPDEDAAPDWPSEQWQEQVLRKLLPRIFPDQSDHDALMRLYEDRHTRADMLLRSRLLIEVDRLIDKSTALRKSLRILGKTRGTDDANTEDA